VLFLATYRDTDVDRRHPLAEVLADFRREPRVSRLSLAGLDETGLGALLRDRAGHDAPPDFVRVLLEETEGNPFFVEEVVFHLVETGVIYQRDGTWVSDLAADDLGLPEGVRDVVGRRLSRLSPAANELLRSRPSSAGSSTSRPQSPPAASSAKHRSMRSKRRSTRAS
jgi:predicted ATPase